MTIYQGSTMSKHAKSDHFAGGEHLSNTPNQIILPAVNTSHQCQSNPSN
jgi:hypothetical protein